MSSKHATRDRVWRELRAVALPDSRFHYDFGSFICDFVGSNQANDRLLQLPCFKAAETVFITPDNCLEYLRYQALRAGKQVLMTTYGIRRGFWLLDPATIDTELFMYASTLDGLERVGRRVSLKDLLDLGVHVDVLVTGTGAINEKGIRFGKGHGYFDLEWAMLSTIGVCQNGSTTIAVVHDCQVLLEELQPEVFDTVCDIIVTPTRTINVHKAEQPGCGIIWDQLQPGMLEDIPPLQEFKGLDI
ncbi:5-formyltetrahydrofolate cyclo-ligase [Rhizodiscina lignyota]|uniref:5-formyltetrahydrofolate cyclo-ligase n=1 Tax=Rhizodiscina lignyota TaxID=1504668 RepID=A0A9P4M522_9PEZI|nr:5-formyltetrahydrofolate cyclo-ligase [Rhizodiscina lignyota]